jgi:hypothetical protein
MSSSSSSSSSCSSASSSSSSSSSIFSGKSTTSIPGFEDEKGDEERKWIDLLSMTSKINEQAFVAVVLDHLPKDQKFLQFKQY